MAIQVWDGTQYVGAELGRFGPTGTLKEALVWDGTQYVKVWPSGPSYPLTGEWSGNINGDTVEIHRWTVPETGEWTVSIEATAASAQTLQAIIVLNDPANGEYLVGEMRFDPGAVAGTHTGTLQAGDTLYWRVFNYPSGHVNATWSIVKADPSGPSLPVVQITGTSSTAARDQFRQACIDYGTTYDTVQVLPFQLDTSQAASVEHMFRDCSSLTSVPDLDTSQVTSMASMFRGCSSLTTVPDLDTSQVTRMNNMFQDCSSLTTVPDLDTSQVRYMANMFYGCSSLTDGNVRLIGRHPSVATTGMINGTGLTREPFYDTNGNPI